MYYVALAIIAAIFIWRIIAGFSNGMVKEIIALISMAIGGVCLVLILRAIGNYMNQNIGKVVQLVVILFVICLVYRIVHVLFASIELISKLPIINWLNKLLGIVVGFLEASIIVGILLFVYRTWGWTFLMI